jgi:hypothetical protein
MKHISRSKYSKAYVSVDIRNGWHEAECKENSEIFFLSEEDHSRLTDGIHFTFSLLISRRIASRLYCIVNTSKTCSKNDKNEYVEIITAITHLTTAKARKTNFKENELKETKCKILTQTNPKTGKVELVKILPK